MTRYDVTHYKRICENGYSYDPKRQSDVAFFPAYPLLARGVVRLTGCDTLTALMAVSAAALALATAMVGLHAYARLRFPAGSAAPACAFLALGLLPTGLFLRLGYSESLFICAALLVPIAVECRWPLAVIAATCGLATAVRPVGVAAVPVFVWCAWSRSPRFAGFLTRTAALLPLSCWGLLGYMAFQQYEYGDCLAFAKTQTHWRVHPDATPGEKAVALLTLEPIRGLFSPTSPRYWERGPNDSPLFNLTAADPVYFVLTALLVALGGARRWLNAAELILAAGLLAVPYATRAYDNSMFSFGRFAVSVVPVYLVMGRLLSGTAPGTVACVAAISGFLLGIYAALFAAGYMVF